MGERHSPATTGLPITMRLAEPSEPFDWAKGVLRPPIVTVSVKAGDSVSAIAAAHGLTLKALLASSENATEAAHRVAPRLGMVRTCPGTMSDGSVTCGLASSSAARVTPNASAIPQVVSPVPTRWKTVPSGWT